MTAFTIDPVILAGFGPPPAGLNIHEQQAVAYDAVSCAVLGLAMLAVALRFWVRLSKGSGLWWDDWAILSAIFFTGATVATTITGGVYGAGKHVWIMNVPRLIKLLKTVYAEPSVYATAVTASKVSILLLYRRLFFSKVDDGNKMFTYVYYGACVLTGIYPIILWVCMACACRPVSFYWRQYTGATDGHCFDVELFFLVLGIVNMLNDVIVLTVPIPRIMRLNMTLRMKLSVLGIMLLGGFVCVASIVRIYYLNGLFKHKDATWWMGPSFAWSSIEPAVAIISACLPTYGPLFRMGRGKGSQGSPYGYDSRGGISGADKSHPRAGGRFGGRNPPGHSRIEDDEVELTCKVTGGNNSTTSAMRGVAPGSKSSSDDDRGIMVKTHVSVTSYGREGNENYGNGYPDHYRDVEKGRRM